MDKESVIAVNDSGVARKNRDKIAQIVLTAVVLLLGMAISLKAFWGRNDIRLIFYWVFLPIGAATLLFCIIRNKLYKSIVFFSIVIFFCFAWVSSILEYGFTFGFVLSGFCCTGVAATAICYAVQAVPDPKKLTVIFIAALTAVNSAICTIALISATSSLFFEVPPQDTMLGCMLGNRLCGEGNSNTLGSSAASLVLLSLCGGLASGKKAKPIYAAALVLGWFTLGLTGSRTSQVGVSFSVCVIVFFVVLSKLRERNENINGRISFVICLKALALSAVFFATAFLSFSLPALIYKGVLWITARISNNGILFNNLFGLSPRDIEDDGTMNGRLQIWVQCIKDFTADVRHFLFGISSDNSRWIAIKDGDMVSSSIHAHNIILEWMRKFGLVGTVIWMIPLVYWIRNGVRTLFGGKSLEDRVLAATAAGLLVMGIAEVVPFYPEYDCLLVPLFFFICGYCVRQNRDGSGKNIEAISVEPPPEQSAQSTAD